MQWVKTNKMFRSKILALVAFAILFLATRIPYLGYDEINPDGVNWHYRSQQFVVALKSHNWAATYQYYHPGVTLMWISGAAIEVFKHITGYLNYDQYNFLMFHFVAKYAVVFTQLALSFILIYYLTKIIGFKKSLLTTLIFSLEPFFLGNSRLYHLDVLLALLIFISLCVSYLNLREFSYTKSIISGLFLALAFLTKSIGIVALLFVLMYAVSYFSFTKDYKGLLKYFLSVSASFALFTFMLFPAMWADPVFYFLKVLTESERIGIREGHSQIIFGQPTDDASPLFYPLVMLMKVSLFVWLGIILSAISTVKLIPQYVVNLKSKYMNPTIFLSLFYFGYFFVMFFPMKKIDRYMLPMYPFLALIASIGFTRVYNLIVKPAQRKLYLGFIVFFFGIFVAVPIVTLYPYFFTYTSPLFGSAKNANKIVAQKPFGIAIPALKDLILEKYGNYPKLGFNDPKPMAAIYPNSKVFDLSINGTSDYDILVLGVNETIPSKVLKGEFKFKKDSSLYINGLEYWRVYVKEAN